ncbi:hypothetical protein [Phyllobacterium meliloti]|uniref:hypothetical protein n=1 Tax=Phyllobacterium meliloti TaxID=555317 RepID=UPI000DDD2A55|nr:hypothetical protein [Phyllobacterium sp. T1293]UGX88449.1 hypothetical protein LLE53_018645 [Phyllobacterium sp. T1293]
MSTTLLLDREAAVIREHTRFHAVFKVYAERYIKVFEANKYLNRVLGVEVNYLIVLELLRLHFNHGAATLTQLQKFASTNNIAGPNKVLALVGLLKRTGYVAENVSDSDKRIKNLVPSVSLENVLYVICNNELIVVDELFDLHIVNYLYENDSFVGRVLSKVQLEYIKNIVNCDKFNKIRLFSQSTVGNEMLMKLMIADTISISDGNRIVPFRYESIAQSLNVSRSHIRRMMERCENLGLVRFHSLGGGAIEILQDFEDMYYDFTSSRFAIKKMAAEKAVSQLYHQT